MRFPVLIVRLLLLLAFALAQARCIVDEQGVIQKADAVDVPGLQGAWEEQRPSAGSQKVYITYTGNNIYRVFHHDKDRQKGSVFDDVFLVPLGTAHSDGYIASIPGDADKLGKPSRLLFIAKLRRNVLELRVHYPDELEYAAGKAGMTLATGMGLGSKVSTAQASQFFSTPEFDPSRTIGGMKSYATARDQ